MSPDGREPMLSGAEDYPERADLYILEDGRDEVDSYELEDSMSYYLWDIRAVPLLTRTREATLVIANQSRVVRLPVHVSERLARVPKAWEGLAQGLGREPTSEEVAAQLGLTAGRMRQLNEVSQQPVSLDQAHGEGSLAEPIEDGGWAELSAQVSEEILRAQVRRALCQLTERERRVVELRYGLDGVPRCTLEQIGREFGLTPERVRQIAADALAKLRRSTSSAARPHAIAPNCPAEQCGHEDGRVPVGLPPRSGVSRATSGGAASPLS